MHTTFTWGNDEAPDPTSSAASTGCFFSVLTKPGPWWKLDSLKKHVSEKAVEDVLEPLVQRYSACVQEAQPTSPPARLSSPTLSTLPSLGAPGVCTTQKYVYPAGGMAVCPGFVQLAPDVVHISPYVQQDEAQQRIIVLSGYLSNISDLVDGQSDMSDRSAYDDVWVSGAASLDGEGGAGALQGAADHAALQTTQVVLSLYDKLGGGQEVLLLSELQGQYAFVVLDAAKKTIFAARDPSGEEDLYYAVGDDGSIMFTNCLARLPTNMCRHPWREMPPGHYMAGKDTSPSQYALSHEELEARERRESYGALDDGHLQPSSLDTTGSPTLHDKPPMSPAASLFKKLSKHF